MTHCPCYLCLSLCALVVLLGLKESLRVNLGLTALNILILLFFIVAGSFHFETSNWLVIRHSYEFIFF